MNLHYSEISISFIPNLIIDHWIHSPCEGYSSLHQFIHNSLVFCLYSHILVPIDPPIQYGPVHPIIGPFKVPVHHYMGGGISIHEGIASGKDSSVLTQVNTEVRELLIVGSYITQISPSNILYHTLPN